MIELRKVSFSYGNEQILTDFNLQVNCGECVQLLGASGSGKTTVARLILGLEKTTAGTIVAPQKISAVFQEDRLLENLDVQKNLKLVLNQEQYNLAIKLLKELRLYDIRKKRISKLSGGMKRRIAIIRAIAYGGDALILDEPFNGLDEENKQIAANIIKREFLSKNKPVLLITHIKDDAELLNAKTTIIQPKTR